MAQEFRTDDPDVRAQIEQVVGEITIDLLSENDCRFNGLRSSELIEVIAGTTKYKLPVDFATIIRICHVVDSDENYIADFTVVDEQEFYHRKGDGNYEGTRYGFVVYRNDDDGGPGYYLILGADWGDTGYIKFYYYREPTAQDTSIIKNEAILKAGVRSRFPQYNPNFQNDIVIYERRKSGFRESPETTTTGIMLKPSKRVQKLNRLDHKIARGQ